MLKNLPPPLQWALSGSVLTALAIGWGVNSQESYAKQLDAQVDAKMSGVAFDSDDFRMNKVPREISTVHEVIEEAYNDYGIDPRKPTPQARAAVWCGTAIVNRAAILDPTVHAWSGAHHAGESIEKDKVEDLYSRAADGCEGAVEDLIKKPGGAIDIPTEKNF